MLETNNRYQEYFNHFSKGISNKIQVYATERALKFSRYIFTIRKGKQQYGYCTHCNNEFETDRFIHNEKEVCPICGSECTVKASGRGRQNMVDEVYFTYYDKSLIKPGVITARGIYAVRDYRADYKNVETQYKDAALYIFEMGDSVMLSRYVAYTTWRKDFFYFDIGPWCLSKKVGNMYGRDHIASLNVAVDYSRTSIKTAVKNTPFQYSTWEKFNVLDMVTFFNLYSKYPCIEYITKLGFDYLIDEKLDGSRTYSAINWRGNSILKVMRLNKQDLKKLRDYSKTKRVSFCFLRLMQLSAKDESNLSLDEIAEIENSYGYYVKELEKILKYTSLRSANNYIRKQFKKYDKHYYNVSQALLTWRDYIADCQKLQLDLTRESVLFPKNLYTAHQNTIKQIKIRANKELDKKIRAAQKDLYKKYYFEHQGLIIRPAHDSGELIDEGRVLNHCVGTYAEKYAQGEDSLLFIRKISDPDKPYYTVELRKNVVIQVRGLRNCSPNEDVEQFIEAFKAEKLQGKKPVKVKVPA